MREATEPVGMQKRRKNPMPPQTLKRTARHIGMAGRPGKRAGSALIFLLRS